MYEYEVPGTRYLVPWSDLILSVHAGTSVKHTLFENTVHGHNLSLNYMLCMCAHTGKSVLEGKLLVRYSLISHREYLDSIRK